MSDDDEKFVAELLSVLSALSNPKYMETLGPELFMRVCSLRMQMSPSAIHENIAVESPSHTPKQDPSHES